MVDLTFENFADFEKAVLLLFKKEGWDAELASPNTPGYDVVLKHGQELIAVQIKNQKAKIALPAIEKFEHFLRSESGKRFSRGIFVSASGFAKTVYAYLDTAGTNNIQALTLSDSCFDWERGSDTDKGENKRLTYIGVFTAKGGVGKTTVAAHLAGAFALSGYEVLLVDLDIQGNLRKLLGDGVFVPGPKARQPGATVTVIDHRDFIGFEQQYPETRVVICDCNPELDANPSELVKRFDYCIVPTTLNPLGINKNIDVIKRTFEQLRQINSTAFLFAMINNYHTGDSNDKRNYEMSAMVSRHFEELGRLDAKCRYIDPIGTDTHDGIAIRFSTQLVYWGYDHLMKNVRPELAFNHVAGRSYPREDFLRLASYLEEQTEIGKFKDVEKENIKQTKKSEHRKKELA